MYSASAPPKVGEVLGAGASDYAGMGISDKTGFPVPLDSSAGLPPGPSPRDWMWGGGAMKTPREPEISASKGLLPDLVNKRPQIESYLTAAVSTTHGFKMQQWSGLGESDISSCTEAEASLAERHKVAAQTARDLAERYTDPVAKLNEKQKAWRRKHEGLVKKKQKEAEDIINKKLQDHREASKAAADEASAVVQVQPPAEAAKKSARKYGKKIPVALNSQDAPNAAQEETEPSAQTSNAVDMDPRGPLTRSAVTDNPALYERKDLVPTVSVPAAPSAPPGSAQEDAKAKHSWAGGAPGETARSQKGSLQVPAETPRGESPSSQQRPSRRSQTTKTALRGSLAVPDAEEAGGDEDNSRRPSKRTSSKRKTLQPDFAHKARSSFVNAKSSGDEGSETDRAAGSKEAPGSSPTSPRGATERDAQWLNSLKGGKGAQQRQKPSHAELDFEQVIQLAKKHNLSVDDVHEKMRDFQDFDTSGNGYLSQDEFEATVRRLCHIPADSQIPHHLLANHFSKIDMDEDGQVSFEEYIIWSMETAYSEEVLVPDKNDRDMRRLARDNDIPITEVERVKKVFDQFDLDGSGNIETEEFFHVIMKLLNAQKPSDVSKKKLERYWNEADRDGSGEISFEEFLLWYVNVAAGGL